MRKFYCQSLRTKSVFLILFLFIAILSSCNLNKSGDKESTKGKLIAKVKEEKLYETDLKGLFYENQTKEDSILIRKSFIDNWILEKLIYYKALSNLSEDEKDKSKELQKYYQSLIRFEYEKKFIDQNLDREVEESEIQKYYEDNKEQFKLKNCILQLIYFKLPLNTPDLDKVRIWYNSDGVSDRDILHQYCLGNAIKYHLDDNVWMNLEDVLKDIPLASVDCRSFTTGYHTEQEDSNYRYFISIKNIKKEGDIPPIEFEYSKIMNIILHKRKIELLNSIELNILNEAIEQNYFTIYE